MALTQFEEAHDFSDRVHSHVVKVVVVDKQNLVPLERLQPIWQVQRVQAYFQCILQPINQNLTRTFHLGDQTLDLSVPLVLFDAVLRKQTLVVDILEGSDALQRFRDAFQNDIVERRRRVYTVRSHKLSVKPEVEEHSFKTVEPLERG